MRLRVFFLSITTSSSDSELSTATADIIGVKIGFGKPLMGGKDKIDTHALIASGQSPKKGKTKLEEQYSALELSHDEFFIIGAV